MRAVGWPSAEPDKAADGPGHVDYLDTPDGPVEAPPGGVYSPPGDPSRGWFDERGAQKPTDPDAQAKPPAAAAPQRPPRRRHIEATTTQLPVVAPQQPSDQTPQPPVDAPPATGGTSVPPQAQSTRSAPAFHPPVDAPPATGGGTPASPQPAAASGPVPPQPGGGVPASSLPTSVFGAVPHQAAGGVPEPRQPAGGPASTPLPRAGGVPVLPPLAGATAVVSPLTGAPETSDRRHPGVPGFVRRVLGRPGAGEGTRGRRAVITAGAVFGLLVVLYGLDLALARGEVPRGVTVAGVPIGGMDKAVAERTLRDGLGPRLDRPVKVRAGDVEETIEPPAAGLALNWRATVDHAGDQPLNPWTRLRSLFADREAGTVSDVDQGKLAAALDALKPKIDHDPAEGTIRFDGTNPVPVDPRQGQALDQPAAAQALVDGWARATEGAPVQLPVRQTPVRSTPESVRAALDAIARPAVSGPVTVNGEGAKATIQPEAIAAAFTFEVSQDGALTPKLDTAKLADAARPQLAGTEQPGKDARIVIEGGRPVVRPSADGRGVNWEKTLAGMPDALRSADKRELTATYDHQPAKFTTDQANALGVKELIGEFTTRGFAPDSGVNIRTIAAEVNGALLKPGETFSLNGYTGPRGTAQGYVEAGIIDKGRPGRAVGGGCSQFATTLYNASYFAGMTDVAHKEHSYYISRYPEAREATVFEGLIDLAFRNDAPTGAFIETAWTPSSITVRIWGTKNYEVESSTGGRSNFTEPETVTIPAGERCTPGNGAQGFTVSNTRVIRDARTGKELKRNTRTAVYNPIPKIVCGGPAPPG